MCPSFKVLGDLGATPVNGGVVSCQETGGTSSPGTAPRKQEQELTTWDPGSCRWAGPWHGRCRLCREGPAQSLARAGA